MNRWIVAAVALLVIAGARYGRPWVSLAIGAGSYPVTASGEAANVVVDGDRVFATRADRGVEVFDGRRSVRVVPPARGTQSVDDLALADGLLFALDARPPGFLSVFRDGVLVGGPVPVEVGPFSGVSAARGRVIVSGGTSRMSMRNYDPRGQLGDVIATNDFGRGQPDVLLASDGTRAFVSTHAWGPYFEVTSVRVGDSLTKNATLELSTFGFTEGGAKPASFPLQAALDGDVLLIADVSGLTIANASSMKSIAHLALDVKPVSVAVRDRVAAIVGSSPAPRLVLVDVRNPASPRVLRSVALPKNSFPTGVAISTDDIVVAAHREGVLFINRSKEKS